MINKPFVMKNCFTKMPVLLMTLSLILTVSSCKKDETSPSTSVSGTSKTTSATENLLFTIKEERGAVLNVKSYFGSIIIYNENPGTSLSQGNSYKITDSYGKSYEFTSSTTFGNRTVTGLFGLAKIFKNNVQIYEEKYDTSDFHPCLTLDNYTSTKSPHTSSIGASKYYWTNGSIITVKFLNNNGSTIVKQKIEKYAHMWEDYANIKFKFVSSTETAQIRIKTDADGMSYTTGLGTQLIDPNMINPENKSNTDQTSHNMRYGWFTDATPETEFSRTVIHEFGHLLGLQHEQRNRDAKINQNKYFQHLVDNSGGKWTLEMAKSQAAFFTAQDDAHYEHQYTTYDPLSIMHYPVPASCTTNGIAVGGSTQLSAGDIAFIGTAYPFHIDPAKPVDPTSITGTIIYTISNNSGTPQVDVIRGTNGLISLVNRQPGNSLNSTNQKYLIFTRTKNGNWYNVAYVLYSSSPLGTTTSTGITNFGPSKGESIMIERQDPGQSLGTLLFREK